MAIFNSYVKLPEGIPKHRIYPEYLGSWWRTASTTGCGGYPILETYVRTAKRPTKICRSPWCCSYPQLYPMKDVPEKMVDGNPHCQSVYPHYIPSHLIYHIIHIHYIKINYIPSISGHCHDMPWLISPAYGTDLHSQAAPWHSSLPGAISWPYLPGPWPATKCRPGLD